jgi:acyl transferase domain-containing protein/phosphopantetheinyl transferase
MSMAADNDIAIVGMAATFAQAADLRQYWQNIVGMVDAVDEASDAWAGPYYDPDSERADRIYTRKGGFLGDLAEFDPLRFGIMPNAVDGGEPDQYLALKLATAALADAGYDERPFDRRRTGVILGRGTYINRGYTNLMQHGMVVDQTIGLLRDLLPDLDDAAVERLRDALQGSLPPFNAEMCPGLVPNVVTGRIANRLDLMGPNFIVDAACASSLIATELAAEQLRTGRCDMMITGGVHASTPPQIYMIFCQIDALSRGAIRPFQQDAGGVLLGEGAGLYVIKRLADAERDGDRIYAVIKGIGSSSDGKALGLLAPRLEGEILALERAYAAAGVDPGSVGLVEAHGTGIPLGDRTEIKALSAVLGERTQGVPRCGIGSVKSMISHCIPAAGAAGLIKTALALHHRVLPPTLCDAVNPELGIEATNLYVNNVPRPWIHGGAGTPRRAGVNAFGFGGVNAHVVLEEYRGPAGQPASLLHSDWPTELLVLSASDRAGLRNRVAELHAILDAHPGTPLGALAQALARRPAAPCRLAIVARDRADLAAKLDTAARKLADDDRDRFQVRSGIYFGAALDPGRVALIFAGEGSQYPNMLAELCLHFPPIRAWFDFLDATFADSREMPPSRLIFPPPTSLTDAERASLDAQLYAMDVGSEAVFTASMALLELLGQLGLRADALVGHSTGENTALVASGILRIEDRADLAERMRQFNRIYLDLARNSAIPRGALLAVGALGADDVRTAISAHGLHLAMDNCPNQRVLFGTEAAIASAADELSARGGVCQPLPFDRAYHTELFAPVAEAFKAFYHSLSLGPAETPVFSCTALDYFPEDTVAIEGMAAAQWASPVRFREAVETLHGQGFGTFIEVSPSGSLTGFVGDTLRGREHLAVACDSRRLGGLSHLQHALARLFVHGVDLDLAALQAFRGLPEVDLEAPAAGTTPAASPRSLRLELNLPVLHLAADTAETLRRAIAGRRPPAAADVGVGADVAAAPTGTMPLTGCTDQPLSAVGPTPPADPRSTLLQGHFALMQSFLAQQQRVMCSISGGDGTTPGPLRMLPGGPAGSGQRPGDTWPLLDDVVLDDQGGLVCERRFMPARDRYLRDHTLGGAPSAHDPALLALPVIPFTFSMEVIAEAALRLVGGALRVARLENLRGSRWLTLDRGHIDLRVVAQAPQPAADGTRVHVRVLQTALPDGRASEVLVFEGDAVLRPTLAQPPSALGLEQSSLRPSRLQTTDLYSTGMFHGPMLQGVRRIRSWSEEGIEAELVVIAADDFVTGAAPTRFQTDAGLLDAAGQLVGYWLSEQFGPDFNCFPYRVASCEQFLPWPAPGSTVICRGRIRFVSDMQIEAAFDLLDQQDRVIARLTGWEDRYFRIPKAFYECRLHPQTAYLSTPWPFPGTALNCRRLAPFPEHFLSDGYGIWKRVLAHLVLNGAERDHWYDTLGSDAQRTQWLLGRVAAKDAVRAWAAAAQGISIAPADVEIIADAEGRPRVRCALLGEAVPSVSISHDGEHVVAVAGPPGRWVGIDLQRLPGAVAEDLLRAGFGPEERQLLASFPEPDQARLTVAAWCAKEAAAKAAGTGLDGDPAGWRVVELSEGRATAQVVHDDTRWEVSLAFADTEVLALCNAPGQPPVRVPDTARRLASSA